MSPALPLLLLAPAFAADAGPWPQWRGPARDGVAVASAPWPASVGDSTLRRVWQSPELGPGYSGPVVAPDRVFVAATVGKKDEVVRALRRDTGEQLWEARWPGSMEVPFFAARNGSWIRATPAYDGRTLYVAGMRDVLVALDGETGKERWRRDFVAEGSTLPTFGFASSPLVDGGFVYVQAGGALQKLDAANGKTVWKSLADGGGMMGSAFASPTFATVAGRRQLLVQTRLKLAGVNADSGDVLWEKPVPAFRG